MQTANTLDLLADCTSAYTLMRDPSWARTYRITVKSFASNICQLHQLYQKSSYVQICVKAVMQKKCVRNDLQVKKGFQCWYNKLILSIQRRSWKMICRLTYINLHIMHSTVLKETAVLMTGNQHLWSIVQDMIGVCVQSACHVSLSQHGTKHQVDVTRSKWTSHALWQQNWLVYLVASDVGFLL